jgi:hypothetical protein
MSVVPSIFSGMDGKKDAVVNVPSMGLINEQLTNKDPLLGRVAYEKAPNILNSAIDYSTRRGVLPCVGITEKVLRQAPPNAANAYQAPAGVGSFSQKGLEGVYYKNDYPVLRPFSSVNIGEPSKLGM